MDKAFQFDKPVLFFFFFFPVQLLHHSFFSLSKQSSMKTGDEGDYLCFQMTFLFDLHFLILILSGQFARILYPLFPALSYLPHVQSFHFFFFFFSHFNYNFIFSVPCLFPLPAFLRVHISSSFGQTRMYFGNILPNLLPQGVKPNIQGTLQF